ncbi:transposase [Actinacidiphila sp. ITFR-21]|uniref:transposase n=1 Tax=Actinacidiphila sp. ITFR-21 TaxID=3075199 RepID=UPI0037D9D58E
MWLSPASSSSWSGRYRRWCTAASRRSGAGGRRRTGSGSPGRTRGTPAGATFHSDHGAQYRSRAFADACRQAGVTQSMSAVGSSADNALAESSNATRKRETLQGRRAWDTERQAHPDLFRWPHRYNTVRRHSRPGHRSPITYERARRTTSTTLAKAA